MGTVSGLDVAGEHYSIESIAARTELNRRTHTRWMEANARHDLSAYHEFMRDDIEVFYQDGSSQRGREAVRAGFQRNIDAMPDYSVELEDQVATEDRVICRWHVWGTPTVTGQRINIRGVSYWDFEDGRAVRGWAYAGATTLQDQIGSRM